MQNEVLGQLTLAVILGAIIGLERELAGKTAGVRTYALVALGSCLFSYISKFGFIEFWGVPGFDPSRIASQIVVGVGFIGAGLIVFKEEKILGLTTAAGLWVSAAIGMAVGFRLYSVAIMTTFLTLAVLIPLWIFERKVVAKAEKIKK
jgi:putative Mg2+ transporter-C (MgtC) family protein